MIRSLAIRTDLMVGQGSTHAVVHPDRIVLRTPAQPDFWYGNSVIFRSFDPDPEPALAQFRRDHPTARHVCLQWDMPDLEADVSRFAALGFEIDDSVTLTLDRRTPIQLPAGITARVITSDDDWAAVAALQHAVGVNDDGREAETHHAYIRALMQSHRKACAEGRARWYGAFDGAQLVGDLGVYADGRLARFQSVETRASHRGRGIAAALVSMASGLAAANAQTVVIVTDRESPAQRVYRRCGYRPVETVLAVARPPLDAAT